MSAPAAPMARDLCSMIRLLRPPQWLKNLFCFGGVVFAGKVRDPAALAQAFTVFLVFCAVSSAVYVFNDLIDREADARHPQKRARPLASGAVRPGEAVALGLVCAAFAGFGAVCLGGAVAAVVLAYAGLNVAYSLGLKRFAILDVMVIAAGFILRVFAGTEAVRVPASAWILICTFFLSMFLGFAKRRAEIEGGSRARAVLADYSAETLQRFCYIFATLAIAAYAIFTTSIAAERTLIITCPPVVYGILRYLLLVERHEGDEQIEAILFRDRPIQAAILLWLGLHAAILYAGLRLNIQ